MKIRLELEIGKKKISLSPDETRELYDVMDKLMNKRPGEYIPYYPYNQPWTDPWTYTTGGTIDAIGDPIVTITTDPNTETHNA